MAFQRVLQHAAGVAVLAGLALPSGALAAPSAYDQYVPLTPSASGPTAPGGHGHGGGSGSVPLSRSAATRLQQLPAADRSILQAIGTSRDLGAPVLGTGRAGAGGGASSTPAGAASSTAAGGSKTSGRGGPHGATAPTVPPTSSSLTAAVHAIGRSPVLPVTLLAALAGALVAGTLRRRRA